MHDRSPWKTSLHTEGCTQQSRTTHSVAHVQVTGEPTPAHALSPVFVGLMVVSHSDSGCHRARHVVPVTSCDAYEHSAVPPESGARRLTLEGGAARHLRSELRSAHEAARANGAWRTLKKVYSCNV